MREVMDGGVESSTKNHRSKRLLFTPNYPRVPDLFLPGLVTTGPVLTRVTGRVTVN